MSKKAYQAIARALYQTRQDLPGAVGAGVILSDVANHLAAVFASDNERFDRARFLEACETGACKGMPKRVA